MTKPSQRLIGAAAFLVSGTTMAALFLSASVAPPVSDLLRFERAARRMGSAAIVNVSKLPPLGRAAEIVARAGGRPLATACFAEGTPPEVIESFHIAMGWDQLPANRWGETDYEVPEQEEGGTAYYLGPRWSGNQGGPRALTWSFVKDGTFIPGNVGEPNSNSVLFATLDAQFSAQGGRATWIARIQSTFDRWSAISGVSYTRVKDGANDWDDGAAFPGSPGSAVRGDVRIAAHPIDGTNGILAYNGYPSDGDMVLDSGENFGGSFELHRTLRNTVAHEHGHGLGLAHVCSTNSINLMEPLLTTNVDGPQHDEFRAIQRHYGDPYENDNTFVASSDLGTMIPGTPVTPCTVPNPISGVNDANTSLCSIDSSTEQDFFKFTVGTAGTASVTVTPRGESYADDFQNANGSCSSGHTTNSLTQADLAVQILASDGTTVLATADTQPTGVAESLTNVALATAGAYYLRVYREDSPTQTQLYTFSLNTQAGACVPASVTVHPNSQSICSGGSVTFNVTGAGTAPLSYQWRKNTVNIGGATSSSYNINPVNTGHAGSYDCVVSNACGSATSNAATLTVNVAPSISVHPTNRTVCAGASTTFNVTGSGTPTPTFQWRKNNTVISGATNSSYTINPVNSGDAGNYDVILLNSCGSITSNAGILTVNVAPSISVHPASQSVADGGSVTFTVTAGGTPAPTYQWRKGGVNIGGATSSSYNINPVDAGDAGVYDVVVSNSCGSLDSNDATLTITSDCDPCDANCDGSVNLFDITDFVDMLGGSPPPPCSPCAGDANEDGSINLFDIDPFVTCLG